MKYKRIIPILLLKDNYLVKTTKFKNHIYIGDCINTIKIFNQKEVDELIILNIDSKIDFELLSQIASESFVPITYGGGIKTIEDAKKIFNLGIERIAVNSTILENFDFLKKLNKTFGKASIVASVDVKKNIFGKYKIKQFDAFSFIKKCSEYVGEVLVTNIERENTQKGYDIDFYKKLNLENIIANGGAKNFNDIKKLLLETNINGAGGGSMFVFKGELKAVLISYPTTQKKEINEEMQKMCNG